MGILFSEKVGNYLLAFALVLQLIGFALIRKIINIKI
jgi:Flp pilus assembly protein TadB